jgi:hypothetical protein
MLHKEIVGLYLRMPHTLLLLLDILSHCHVALDFFNACDDVFALLILADFNSTSVFDAELNNSFINLVLKAVEVVKPGLKFVSILRLCFRIVSYKL